jgi:hypothetical protein
MPSTNGGLSDERVAELVQSFTTDPNPWIARHVLWWGLWEAHDPRIPITDPDLNAPEGWSYWIDKRNNVRSASMEGKGFRPADELSDAWIVVETLCARGNTYFTMQGAGREPDTDPVWAVTFTYYADEESSGVPYSATEATPSLAICAAAMKLALSVYADA